MPLLVLSAEDAAGLGKGASRWPSSAESQRDRLAPVARPQLSQGLRFDKSDLLFTIGSCFARNIEKQLLIEGYNVAISRFHPPVDGRYPADPEMMLHRYVPQAISNELNWGVGGAEFPDAFFVEVTPGGWCDLQLNSLAVAPAPRELVVKRREAISTYMSAVADAKLVIITVGLAEAWFDRETGLYLNAMPHPKVVRSQKGRFEFHLLSYDEILASLEQTHRMLATRCRADQQILITVSPVALSTTFTGNDVLVANTYMKSALRTAVEAFVRAHANAHYFPSYESVILSDRRRAWREDQAHVSDELIRLNVLRMIEAYAVEPGDVGERVAAMRAYDFIEDARQALEWGSADRAERAYRAAVAAAPRDPQILLEFGRFLTKRRRLDEALPILEASLQNGSGVFGGYARLAQAHLMSEKYAEARDAAARAREIQPTNLAALDVAATAARKLKLFDEALALAEEHSMLCPDSEESRQRVERLRVALAERNAGPVLAADVQESEGP